MLEAVTSALKFGGELLGFVKRLPIGAWRKLTKRLPRETPARTPNNTDLPLAIDSATVSIESAATGELSIYLTLSNFLAHPVIIDNLSIDYWLLQYQAMPEPHVIFKSSGTLIERQASILVKIRLYEKEIAQARNTIPIGWTGQEVLVRRGLFDLTMQMKFTENPRTFVVKQRIQDAPLLVSGAANATRTPPL
jgi:hypothetical protein